MSLPHTILGFLSLEPMTGYDLKKLMDNSTQFFWHAQLSQIYPTLKQLERQGLVQAETMPQVGKPDKKIFTITKAGRAALAAWLSEPLDQTPPTKSPVLLKLFFLGALDKADILAQMRCQLEAQRARLKRYQLETSRYIRQARRSAGFTQQAVLWELIRQYGALQTQTSIQWLEQALRVVEKKL